MKVAHFRTASLLQDCISPDLNPRKSRQIRASLAFPGGNVHIRRYGHFSARLLNSRSSSCCQEPIRTQEVTKNYLNASGYICSVTPSSMTQCTEQHQSHFSHNSLCKHAQRKRSAYSNCLPSLPKVQLVTSATNNSAVYYVVLVRMTPASPSLVCICSFHRRQRTCEVQGLLKPS